MHSLDLDNGQLKFPLSVVNSFSYNKTANIIQVTQLYLRTRGYGCQNLSFSVSLTPATMGQFKDINDWMRDYSFADLVRYFIEYKTSLDRDPYNVILAGKIICPELMFTVTQVSTTFQADDLGNMQQIDISFTLAGCRCTKQSSRNKTLTTADSSILKTKLVVDNTELDCRDDVAISEFTIMPTSLRLQLILSDSFKDKYSNDWLRPSDANTESYVEVEGFGKFFVITSSVDDNIVTYECSIFDKRAEDSVAATIMDSDLNDVLGHLSLATASNLKPIRINHYRLNGSSIDILREIGSNLGCLIAFSENKAYPFEVPTSIPADVTNDDSNLLNFYLDEDVKSAPVCKVIYRDAENQYTVGDKKGHTITVNSPICTPTDRSKELLNYYTLLESSINLTVPFDPRIRHLSWVKVNLGASGILPCLVADYIIDVLENSMTLTLNYIKRG